jgi:hypothetical protein
VAEAAAPLRDPLAEAERVLDAADAAGVTLRAAGGVAVALICPSARRPPLQRSYQDIDFVTRGKRLDKLEELLARLGYRPDREFNAIHAQDRLFFADQASGRQLDIFVERIEMCHPLELARRLELSPRTLSPADLLLSKLQVVQTNEKDYLDMVALLSDQPFTDDEQGINLRYVADLCASDWGWWKTATMVAQRARDFSQDVLGLNGNSPITEKVRTILSELESAPKSRRWKLRARVGERVRWYEVPEEVEH